MVDRFNSKPHNGIDPSFGATLGNELSVDSPINMNLPKDRLVSKSDTMPRQLPRSMVDRLILSDLLDSRRSLPPREILS